MITLALIGFGDWGKKYYRTINEMSDVRLGYICVRHKSSDFPKSIPWILDYRKLPLDKIAGVIIATPPNTHFQIATHFLSKNVHVLIEKPFVTNLSDAKKLEKLWEKSKSIVLVGHIYLYNTNFLKVLRQAGKMKKIIAIDSEGYNSGPVRNDVSALWDWGPHDIAMSLAIIKKMPIAVSAYGIKDGNKLHGLVYLHLKFPESIEVLMKVGWLETEKRRRLTIFWKTGRITFDDLTSSKNNTSSPLENEIRAFISAMKTGKNPFSDLSFGVKVVTILAYAEKSLQKGGKAVKLPSNI